MRESWQAPFAGRLCVVVRETGKPSRRLDGRNLVLTAASHLAHRALAGDAGAAFAAVAVGTSETAPSPEDVGPLGDSVQVALLGVSHPMEGVTEITFRVGENDANALGTIAEFVLVTADGTAFARTLRGPITKNAKVQIDGTWTITGVLTDAGE